MTPQSQQMELRPPVSGVGTVVSGEASESDEESAAPLNLLPSLHVSLPVSAVTPTTAASSVTKSVPRPSSDSLLHRKLRETNTAIREELHGLLQKQYETATKNVRTTIQQLTTSQQTIQEISYTMRLLTNNLFQLEDKTDIVVTCPILPEVNVV